MPRANQTVQSKMHGFFFLICGFDLCHKYILYLYLYFSTELHSVYIAAGRQGGCRKGSEHAQPHPELQIGVMHSMQPQRHIHTRTTTVPAFPLLL